MGRLGRLLSVIRDGWLVFGAALLLFVVLEGGYRAQLAIKRAMRGDDDGGVPPLHPYHGQRWFVEFQGAGPREDRFDAYRGYWSRPYASRYKNVDSLGRRVTIQPPFDSATALRVFMLGGSTLFGFNARDSTTIASLTAARLAARGVHNVEVVNLSQGGYNVTQEAITLLLELARGRAPEVAVFFDGQNDIQAVRAFGEPGHAFIEPRTQSLIDLARRGFGAELVGLGRHSAVIQRLRQTLRGAPGQGVRADTSVALCGPLAAYYRAVARTVEDVARARGFEAFFFQQPMHSTTNKPRSPWERTLLEHPPFRHCAASIDSAMQPEAGRLYFSLASLFDADTATAYTDQFAHLTEWAHEAIADRIAGVIAPTLVRRSRASLRRP